MRNRNNNNNILEIFCSSMCRGGIGLDTWPLSVICYSGTSTDFTHWYFLSYLQIQIKILALCAHLSPDLSVFSPSPLSSHLSLLNLLPPSSSSSSISPLWLRVKLPLDVLSSLLSCCRTETWLRQLHIMTPEKEGGRRRGEKWEMGREIGERRERAREEGNKGNV